jgi:glycosyltransferase involved in cell wall biosynthesis
MKLARVSIVIPVYNEEGSLGACLEAIAAQTVRPYEVIIVDNNSSDKSVAIARSFPSVRIIEERRQGVVHARNAGFDAAKGDIIGRIDADTLVAATWVKRLKETFADTRVAAVTGPVGYYDMPLPMQNRHVDHWARNGLCTLASHTRQYFGPPIR